MTEIDATPQEREYRREVNTNCFREIFQRCETGNVDMHDGTNLLTHASTALKNGAKWHDLGPRDKFLSLLVDSINAQVASAETAAENDGFMDLIWISVILEDEAELYAEIQTRLDKSLKEINAMLESYC